MATHNDVDRTGPVRGRDARESWTPMIAIALGQMIMSFNVASLPVAMGGMVQELRRSADHGRDRHRGLFDAGRRLRHAGRQARRNGSGRCACFRAAVVLFCAYAES